VEEELRILSIKLTKLSKSYKKLKEDNDRLKADIGYLKKEEERHRERMIENETLKEKAEKSREKTESGFKKNF
jgi:threonyl-tRNA synthetase